MKKTTRLSPAEKFLISELRSVEQAAITQYAFYRMLHTMYAQGNGLCLKHDQPTLKDHQRYLRKLYHYGTIRYDEDYGTRLIRILDNPLNSTEELVCLADTLSYVSHLSAMRRWGLTERSPTTLIFTRPNRSKANATLAKIMAQHPNDSLPRQVRLSLVGHPATVRGQKIRIFESTKNSTCVRIHGTGVRIATVGQTFVDMLRTPSLCSGMPHVLDVFREHAGIWREEIITSVGASDDAIVKCRAGYVLEELLRIHDTRIDSWKKLAQRGGSRKLDPGKSYASEFSETWQISINV